MREHVVEVQGLGAAALHARGVEAVVAEAELHHVPGGGAHRQVVLEGQVLQGLHQPPGHVARLRRLHSRVDEAFSAAHRVEEELGRLQAAVEGVLDEAARLGLLAPLEEVRQGPVHETVFDPLAADVLLPQARHHLAQIDGRALGAARGHDARLVHEVQRLLAHLAHLVSDLAQLAVHDGLQGLLGVAARLELQRAVVVLLDALVDDGVLLVGDAPLLLRHSRAVRVPAGQPPVRGVHVVDADGHASVHQPPGGDLGQAAHASDGRLGPAVPD
mmetsp:Transcript_7818/g.23150  ORF Transcript_7818/g.23150 Transcript_7818/m.23150 type:complete len:273 (-) Transcript_7818:1948-2766(-)